MGRPAFATAIVSVMVLLAGLTAGLVAASGLTASTPRPDAAVTQTVASDRAALVALYNATDGPNWSNNTNWLSNAPLGEWYGVSADSSGRVVKLNLYRNRLSGTIPRELGNLANLESLVLHNNQLSGEIPTEFGNLANLVQLSSSSNRLSGEIPSELGNLAQLELLNLSSNQLSGKIPPELGNLANLGALHLSYNQLSGDIPTKLGDLTQLESLDLFVNQFSGEMPSELGHLANLQSLLIFSNQLSGEIPPEFGNLANLVRLSLSSNQLSGEIPPELGDLTQLASLDIYNNQLSGEVPSELGDLTNLQLLVLSGNQLSGEIPLELGNLANLHSLSLHHNQLSGKIPEDFGRLSNLQSLDLSRNQLNGEIPSELGGLTNLGVLGLYSNQLSGEIPSQLGSLTNLRMLLLSGNQLSGKIPVELGKLASLQTLWLSGNQLEGCIPRGLDGVENNDLGRLGLLFCRVPGPPTITALIIAGDNSLTIAWAAPTSGPAVTGYDLRYIRTDADETVEGNWTVVEDVWTGEGALRYALAGLAAGTQYDVQVRAVSPGGNGPWSATVSGTPLGRVEDGDSLGNKVAGVKVEATPNYPNTIAKWTVQFVNGDISSYWYDGTDNKDQDDNILDGGTGKDVIMVEFEDDVQFPEAVSPNDVVITTNMVWDDQAVDRTVVANPLGVNVIKVAEFAGYVQQPDRPPDETLVTLEIPDMEPADDRSGYQGIAPGATVTVTFRQTAGIKNPTESKADEVYQAERAAAVDANGDFDASLLKPLSGYKVQVATSNNGYFVPAALGNRAVIPRRLVLSDMDGPRGSTVTVVGLGFRNSITAVIWNDKNQNGARDGGEIDLGHALITGSDDFTTTITINNPPFSSDLSTNGINAMDGRNRTIIPGRRYMGAISGATLTESIPEYLLESSFKVSPGTAAIGDRVQVTARDFVAGGNIAYAQISIGGVPVTDYEATVVSGTGDATFEMTIPDGVAPGTQKLIIKDGPDALNDPGHDIVNGGGSRTSIVIIGGVIPGALDVPIIKTPIVAGDRSLTITWRAPIETRRLTPIGYDLRYIRTDADETVEVNWTLAGTIWKIGFEPLEYVLTGLTAGTQYDVQLRAVNAVGASSWSATATGTPSTWGAIRYLSETYVKPGSEVRVTINATGYGLYGHVVETLPPGFSYEKSDLNENAVIVSGRDVIFFLSGQVDFTYTVTASATAGEYFLSGGIVNENRLQQTVGWNASIRVGVGPLVNAFSFSRALVRIDAPIQVLVTFSEPVFGFALGDIGVSNGIADNFAGSDGSAYYEFDVTPNAVGAVTVDIAAGAGMDAEGNGNIAAPQLSLGIPYDDDHDGAISKEEAIAAVIDYFNGRITKEEAIAIIILYFSS